MVKVTRQVKFLSLVMLFFVGACAASAPHEQSSTTETTMAAELSAEHTADELEAPEPVSFSESQLVVGKVLADDGEVVAANAALRELDRETRAGRVVVFRDGEYRVTDIYHLSSDDIVDDENAVEIQFHPLFTPIYVIDGQNVVDVVSQRAATARRENLVRFLSGGEAVELDHFMAFPDFTDQEFEARAGMTREQFIEAVHAAVPALEEMPTEIAVAPLRGNRRSLVPGDTVVIGTGFGIVWFGGTQGVGGADLNTLIPQRDRFYGTPEAALEFARSFQQRFPDVILHDMTG